MLVLSSVTGGINLPATVYYCALAILGYRLIMYGHLRASNKQVFLLLIICAISLALNNPPSYFRAWQRLGVFSLVLFVASPMLSSSAAAAERYKVLEYFINICIVVSVGSFFAYFLGINLFVRNDTLLDIGSGSFSGLTNHSMVLGPVAGLSCICLFARVFEAQNTAQKSVEAVLFVLCLMSCFLSASRGAVVATIVGCMFVLCRIYHDRIGRMFLLLIVLISMAAATFPFWGGMTNFLVQKQLGNEQMGGVFYSREQKFDARLKEFESSPLYGIGYNVVNPNLDQVNLQNGQIEPGSSWLAILSMTGIIGFVCFSLICIRALKRAWRIEVPILSGVLGGCLFFFFIHFFAEGYVFAPKSFLILLFWLIVAVIEGCISDEQFSSLIV